MAAENLKKAFLKSGVKSAEAAAFGAPKKQLLEMYKPAAEKSMNIAGKLLANDIAYPLSPALKAIDALSGINKPIIAEELPEGDEKAQSVQAPAITAPAKAAPATEPAKKKGLDLGALLGGAGKTLGGGLEFLANNKEDLAKIAAGLAADKGNVWLGEGYMGEANKLREERMKQAELDAAQQNALAKLAYGQGATETKEAQKKLGNLKMAISGTKDIQGKINKVEEILGNIKSGKLAGLGEVAKKMTVGDKEVKEYDTIKGLTLSNMARTLGGDRGVLTDLDIKRIEGAWPKITDTKEERAASIEMIKQIIDEGVKHQAQGINVSPEDLGYSYSSKKYSGESTLPENVSRETSGQQSKQLTKEELKKKWGLD